MNTTDYLPLPLPDHDLPPIPKAGAYGPQVCETIELYLAILDDLSPEQTQQVLEHVRNCANCAAVQRLMQQTTRAFTRLPASTPSERVDQAVMTSIAGRLNPVHRGVGVPGPDQIGRSPTTPSQIGFLGRARTISRRGGSGGDVGRGRLRRPRRLLSNEPRRPYPTHNRIPRKRNRSLLGAAAAVAMVAVLLLALVTTLHFLGGAATQSFALPPTLTWNGYVLYHSETRLDNKGARYRVETYHDMRTGRLHVETLMPGSLDVVAVGSAHAMLGLDMMHHVAQWGADDWGVDETAFDLSELRSDLAAQRAFYLDKDTFHGQPVYRVRCRNGQVLLLSMDYKPVNVLRGAVGTGTGEPMYDTLILMPSSHVASSMWAMSVPTGFRMGKLPAKP